MSEWKKYEGTDEQIAEMLNAENGFIIRSRGIESKITHKIDRRGLLVHCDEYLICNTHPLADMICQLARTGQPVWWRSKTGGGIGLCHENFPPFMHPVEFEYSFTPFEGEI